jgi:hypothetical protein
MEFGRTNLWKELQQESNHEMESFLSSVKDVLIEEVVKTASISENIKASKGKGFDAIDIDVMDEKRLFSIEDIKSIAVRYRLRFLPSHLLKEEVPLQAVTDVSSHQKLHNTTVTNSFILAPKAKFVLSDCDSDPLLFSRIGENHFYLVAQWGGDISTWRKIVYWPMKNAKNAISTIIAIALFLALVIPDQMLLSGTEARVWPLRIMFFIQCLFITASISTMITFMKSRNFSIAEWNSPHFNS